MSSDALIRFEEGNWDELIEKFIVKYRDKWEQFVLDEFEGNMPEPDIDSEMDRMANEIEEHGRDV